MNPFEKLSKNIEKNLFKTKTITFDLSKQKFDFLFSSDEFSKNHFYFENLCDQELLTNDFNDSFATFYKRIAKSGVGIVIFDGSFDLNKSVLSEKRDKSSSTIKLMHNFGCKTILRIKPMFGRYSNAKAKIKLSSNFGFDPVNNKGLTLRISDGKCNKIIKQICSNIKLSSQLGFDGIMLDATFENIIGELSSQEFNHRIFGYFSETTDFINKVLKNVESKNELIILKISLLSLYVEKDSQIELFSISKKISTDKILSDLCSYVNNGVDGFEFVFGKLENEFLNNFNKNEDEYIFKDFMYEIRKYFSENKIKNKSGNDVVIFYNDNITNLNNANEMIKDGIINYLNVTRQIYADTKYLNKIKTKQQFNKCIKCGYCNQMEKQGKIGCLVNPSLTDFREDTLVKKDETIAVVGSGVSGLICAIKLVQRGYIVHIYEKNKEINHNGKIYSNIDEGIKNYFSDLETKIKEYISAGKIDLKLDTEFNTEKEQIDKYKSIVVATGYKTKYLSIVGSILSHVENIYNILENFETLKGHKNIVIYAKTMLSIRLALKLIKEYKNITIIIKNPYDIINYKNANLIYYFYILAKNNANIKYFCRIKKINEDNIEINYYQKINNDIINNFLKILKNDVVFDSQISSNIDCDFLIYEPDTYPNNKLYYDLVNSNYGGELYLVGDALNYSSLSDTILSSYFVGKNI